MKRGHADEDCSRCFHCIYCDQNLLNNIINRTQHIVRTIMTDDCLKKLKCRDTPMSQAIVARVKEIMRNLDIAERMSTAFAPAAAKASLPSLAESPVVRKYHLTEFKTRNQKFMCTFLGSQGGDVMTIICWVAILLVYYTENEATEEPKLEGVKNYLHRQKSSEKDLHNEKYCGAPDHRQSFIDDFIEFVVRDAYLTPEELALIKTDIKNLRSKCEADCLNQDKTSKAECEGDSSLLTDASTSPPPPDFNVDSLDEVFNPSADWDVYDVLNLSVGVNAVLNPPNQDSNSGLKEEKMVTGLPPGDHLCYANSVFAMLAKSGCWPKDPELSGIFGLLREGKPVNRKVYSKFVENLECWINEKREFGNMEDAGDLATTLANSPDLWSADFFGFLISVTCLDCNETKDEYYSCVQLQPPDAPVVLTEALILDSLTELLYCTNCLHRCTAQISSPPSLLLLCSPLGGNIKYSRDLAFGGWQYKLIGVVDYYMFRLHYTCRLFTSLGFVEIDDEKVGAAVPDQGDNEDFTKSLVALYRKSEQLAT